MWLCVVSPLAESTAAICRICSSIPQGVDEVQSLDFATGIDLAKWYFEASPRVFYRKESDGKVMCFRHWPCAGCWGGKVRRAEKNIEAS